jgi:hypothetical protein
MENPEPIDMFELDFDIDKDDRHPKITKSIG